MPNLPAPQTQNITAYVPQSSLHPQSDDSKALGLPKTSISGVSNEGSKEPESSFSKRKSGQTKNLKGRNSSDDLNSPGQQIITLTVGSRVEKQQIGKAGIIGKENELDVVVNTDGEGEADQDGKIRVAIPDREVYDTSMAATEQNKTSVVSQNKNSSGNSSSMISKQQQLDRAATNIENK